MHRIYLYFSSILIVTIFGMYGHIKVEAQQAFQITNFHCVSITLNGDEANCQGKYTLVGTPPNPGYNIDFKLIKSFVYNGTHPDGTQVIVHAINQFGQVSMTVTNLPLPQDDSDIVYNVEVHVDDHLGPEYSVGSFSFTIPKKNNPSTPPTGNTVDNPERAIGLGLRRVFSNKQFSGVVLKMKATEIETLENSGFVCPVPGQTLTIRQKGKSGYQPTSYVVFAHTKSKTLTPLAVQQKIIGKYGTKYPIVCVLEAVPPVVQVVMLDMITLYGNSKQ